MNTFSKQPAETYTIRVDCTGKLPEATTLSTGTVALFNALGTDLSSTMLSNTIANIVDSEARVKVIGGTHGLEYRIRFLLTLSNADVLEEDVLMRVENR
jgi:hypothetical protein